MSNLLFEIVAARCGRACWYCGRDLTNLTPASGAVLDHVMPRSLGGKTEAENLVLACHGCNSAKSSRTVEEFREVRARQAGMRFTDKQLDYLASIGITVPQPSTFIFPGELRDGR